MTAGSGSFRRLRSDTLTPMQTLLMTSTESISRDNAERRRSLAIALSLAAVYLVWGSTYYAMRVALGGFPPLLMGGVRFTLAGMLLYAALRARGAAPPTRGQWARSALVGVMLLAFGNGGVAMAEQWVASGLAAVMIASVPLWAALFGGLFGRWPTRRELVGLAIGAGGVLVLNLGGGLSASPRGAALLLGASASWALGSVWSRRLDLPSGLMASAAQMLGGGAVLLVTSLARGDRPSITSAEPVIAVGYLVLFGSIVAYSAYGYLLRTVSPALATSYAFVNPVVAVILGVSLGSERIGWTAVGAMAVILAGVALVVLKPRAK